MPQTYTLHDLKRNDKKNKDNDVEIAGPFNDGNKYPFGTEIDFDKDTLEKVSGIDNFNDGDDIEINAVGVVTSKRSDADTGKTIHMSVQLKKIGYKPKGKSADDEFKRGAKEVQGKE